MTLAQPNLTLTLTLDPGDLQDILDTCADGVFEELDYRLEAKNAVRDVVVSIYPD